MKRPSLEMRGGHSDNIPCLFPVRCGGLALWDFSRGNDKKKKCYFDFLIYVKQCQCWLRGAVCTDMNKL